MVEAFLLQEIEKMMGENMIKIVLMGEDKSHILEIIEIAPTEKKSEAEATAAKNTIDLILGAIGGRRGQSVIVADV